MKKDTNTFNRKQDHIQLAFESKTTSNDTRFYYEPLLNSHPNSDAIEKKKFLGKNINHPLWVSSMTGGTALAHTINTNLARACGEFGFGMGLGSCRSLLESSKNFDDFNVRDLIGEYPLYANLGIAQVEQLLANKAFDRAEEMVASLQADGLIIHINPLQEWLQPEGDNITRPPIDVLREVTEASKINLIVKEVGQGFGPESLKALLALPVQAIETSAFGGTNFSLMEILRSQEVMPTASTQQLANVGHTNEEMLNYIEEIVRDYPAFKTKELILSGGITGFLDGYYYLSKSSLNAVYGQASAFLRHAQGDYKVLKNYVENELRGLQLATNYLKVR